MSKASSSAFLGLGLCPHRPRLLMNCKWSVRTQTIGENGARTESNEVNRDGVRQTFLHSSVCVPQTETNHECMGYILGLLWQVWLLINLFNH